MVLTSVGIACNANPQYLSAKEGANVRASKPKRRRLSSYQAQNHSPEVKRLPNPSLGLFHSGKPTLHRTLRWHAHYVGPRADKTQNIAAVSASRVAIHQCPLRSIYCGNQAKRRSAFTIIPCHGWQMETSMSRARAVVFSTHRLASRRSDRYLELGIAD